MWILVTKPSLQHILWDKTWMWLKENPNLKAATGGSGSLNPAAFPGQRRRNSATGSTYLGGFPCHASRADTWSSAWQHTNPQPCILISFMGVGSINQHFSLQLPQNPYVMQAQCQEISQLLGYSFFSPPTFHGCSKRQPRETAHPRSLTACVLGIIWRVFSLFTLPAERIPCF